jgi:hypothetical protein
MSEPEDITQQAEERWTTVRTLVWQGWAAAPQDEPLIADAGRTMLDTDGGLWTEAEPEACDKEGVHLPRWHPAEFLGHFYCTRCGAQGVKNRFPS